MRTITVTGHLAADAQMMVSKSGNEFMSFRIGSNEFNDKKDGVERTYWFRVTCSNKTYFNLAKFLTKGRSVIVTGDYKDDIYQNNAGQCEISRDIFANAIYFNNTGGGSTATTTTSTTPHVSTQTVMTTEGAQNTVSTAEIEVPKKRTSKAKAAKAVLNEVPSSTTDDDDELPF